MHPAESRGYRELMLSAEEARTRLRRLAGHLEQEPRAVADKALEGLADMLDALRPALAEHDLHGDLAARGGGARIGQVRSEILDRFLERNQALRFAVDDLEHVATLLAYMAAVSTAQRKEKLPELCGTWERKMRRHVNLVRKAAVEMGTEPNEAIEPIDPTPIGQVAHGAAVAAGTVGEAVDKTVAAVKAKAPFAAQADSAPAAPAAATATAEKAEAADEPKRRGLFRKKS